MLCPQRCTRSSAQESPIGKSYWECHFFFPAKIWQFQIIGCTVSTIAYKGEVVPDIQLNVFRGGCRVIISKVCTYFLEPNFSFPFSPLWFLSLALSPPGAPPQISQLVTLVTTSHSSHKLVPQLVSSQQSLTPLEGGVTNHQAEASAYYSLQPINCGCDALIVHYCVSTEFILYGVSKQTF